MGGKLRIKKKDEKRIVKSLTRQQARDAIDEELKIKGAFKTIEELQKKVEKLEKLLKKLSGQYDKLYAWMGERQRQQAQEDGE